MSQSNHEPNAQPPSPSPLLLSLAKSYPHDPAHLHKVLLPQLTHRLRLASLWSIAPGSRVLDIGCGQGDSALVLSQAVAPLSIAADGDANNASPGPGQAGHITALDPAPGDYGSPYTLAQSQSHISSSPHGAAITFHQSDAPTYLASHPSSAFDAATLCHSLWYFPSGAAITSLFKVLYKPNVSKLCFAEYALKARTPAQKPHELAVAAQKRFYALRAGAEKGFSLDQGNVRGALAPEEIVKLAEGAGWKVRERGVVDTPGLLDGAWEVGVVVDASWAEEVVAEGLGKDEEEELLGYVREIRDAVEEIKKGGGRVETMGAVWVVMER
ncbi:SAM-dependent methyltransferase [Colletotrichum tamarilloi]|uniref:SAM-dependent methyltransferase n=1 Tax=Colletotrichum tamarilloi TaxID=1209934 RepID=A0ABQ9RKR4_9PEZI|nr:SAM-dependent methyltransferase [Colletotrichum tamarilloi]KAK1506143.1 SAM-dependent methyltransferase [Colletotrichum tamarilloi]